MFIKHSCNLNNTDSYTRITLASFLFAYTVYSHSPYLLFLVIPLYYTGFRKFCFIYYFFKINQGLSTTNYYLSFLPKYNPSAVFIFDNEDDLVFQNEAAKEVLTHIDSPQCIDIKKTATKIQNNQNTTFLFQHEEKYYQVHSQGMSKEKLLLVYLTDITEVFQLNNELEETQKDIIYAMGEIGETRSKETGNHVRRVAHYSKELALLYGLSIQDSNKLKLASPMHDIGKVAIPDAILNAPRKLTDEEWVVMKTHASLGYEMLKNSKKSTLQAAAIVANEHHEKWDGSGYPNAKRGEEIHIYGRITAIADVFDALGSERVYKKAWELQDILKYFQEKSGEHFDPTLISLFLNNLERFLAIRDEFQDVFPKA